MLLRARGRAVTAQDFEELALEVAPEAARAHCLTAAHESQAGLVRVLIVPHVSSDALERVRREDLDPLPETVERIAAHLDQRRLVGTRVVIEPPAYQWLTVVVGVTALPGYPRDQVYEDVQRALNRLLHPLKGGPDHTGWPVARAVQLHEVAAALAPVPGVNMAEEVTVRLFPADPSTGERGQPVDRVPLARNALVYSYRHQVRVN